MDPGSTSVTSLEELSPSKKLSTFAGVFPWMPYAVAAGLMLIALMLAIRIFALKAELQSLRTELGRADESLDMISLRLNSLEARDPAYQAARIAVAWDAFQHRGTITVQDLPAPAAGYNYQLWILDPGALTPLSAGLIQTDKPSATFKAQSLSTVNPGFAITLEPDQGSPEPTGSILFAIEPGQ
jgi:hypothetical protein